jgi:hypothetical protein
MRKDQKGKREQTNHLANPLLNGCSKKRNNSALAGGEGKHLFLIHTTTTATTEKLFLNTVLAHSKFGQRQG